jgi:hypothetical protein
VAVALDEQDEPLDFKQVLEQLLDLIGKRLDVSIRAQGTTILEEVMTATGTLVSGIDFPDWVRQQNHALLDGRLRFWLDSWSSFWLCRPEPVGVEQDGVGQRRACRRHAGARLP